MDKFLVIVLESRFPNKYSIVLLKGGCNGYLLSFIAKPVRRSLEVVDARALLM